MIRTLRWTQSRLLADKLSHLLFTRALNLGLLEDKFKFLLQ